MMTLFPANAGPRLPPKSKAPSTHLIKDRKSLIDIAETFND